MFGYVGEYDIASLMIEKVNLCADIVITLDTAVGVFACAPSILPMLR